MTADTFEPRRAAGEPPDDASLVAGILRRTETVRRIAEALDARGFHEHAVLDHAGGMIELQRGRHGRTLGLVVGPRDVWIRGDVHLDGADIDALVLTLGELRRVAALADDICQRTSAAPGMQTELDRLTDAEAAS